MEGVCGQRLEQGNPAPRSAAGASDLSLVCQARSRNRTASSDTAPFPLYKEPSTVLISWATPEGGLAILNPELIGRILNSIGVAVSLRGSLPYHISKLLTKAQNKILEHPGELQ